MNERVVDARGKLCPEPLILTKKALGELDIGQTMKVLIDNETSRQNVERFLKDNGARSVCADDKGLFTLSVTKLQDEMPSPNAEEYCATPQPAKRHVIVISSDKMGRGPDELGAILMKAFINTIKDVDPLPSSIIFYSTGILLVVNGSPLVDPLRDLVAKGVKVLVCGTCADYFLKKNQVMVGTISNMYTILETITKASHAIAP
jgi:selenium metabolism protein YedF